MQDLIVSMMRFSAALTLFGMEQIQKSLNVVDGEEDLSKTMDRLEKAVNSLTDVLVNRIDDKKKETLKSVTKMSEDVVGKTADGVNWMVSARGFSRDQRPDSKDHRGHCRLGFQDSLGGGKSD